MKKKKPSTNKRIPIKETNANVLYHHTGMTSRPGCQCYGDCSCHDDWVSQPYDYYTVVRKRKKTTFHNTLEDAMIRWNFVCKLKETCK